MSEVSYASTHCSTFVEPRETCIVTTETHHTTHYLTQPPLTMPEDTTGSRLQTLTTAQAAVDKSLPHSPYPLSQLNRTSFFFIETIEPAMARQKILHQLRSTKHRRVDAVHRDESTLRAGPLLPRTISPQLLELLRRRSRSTPYRAQIRENMGEADRNAHECSFAPGSVPDRQGWSIRDGAWSGGDGTASGESILYS